jgi:hypothetical protein
VSNTTEDRGARTLGTKQLMPFVAGRSAADKSVADIWDQRAAG